MKPEISETLAIYQDVYRAINVSVIIQKATAPWTILDLHCIVAACQARSRCVGRK